MPIIKLEVIINIEKQEGKKPTYLPDQIRDQVDELIPDEWYLDDDSGEDTFYTGSHSVWIE